MNAIASRAFSKKIFQKASNIFLVFYIGSPGFLVAQTTITGKVSDVSGAPIVGASVYFEANAGTSTNNNGQYILQTSLTGRKELVVSFVGYKTVSRAVDLIVGTITVDVQMEQESTGLNSVVVTATS